MGKNKKGKNQQQESAVNNQSSDVQPSQSVQEIGQEQFIDSAVLIQPNQHQQKIIEEILKDEEDENSQQNLKKKEESKKKQVVDLIDTNDVTIVEKKDDIIDQGEQKHPKSYISTEIIKDKESQQQSGENSLNSNTGIQQTNEQSNAEQAQQQQQQIQGQNDPRFVVSIFDQAKYNVLLPWAYAIENELISPLEYDNEGFHLIHRAAISNSLDIVHSLVEKHGVPVDLPEKNLQQTPLIFASLYGHFKLMKYLLDRGANVNAVDKNQFTPLVNSVMNRHKLQSVYLMSKGANLNSLDQDSCNIAHRAAFNNDVPMLQIINQVAREQFEAQDRYRLAPVGRAITNDSHQAFQYLQKVKPIPVPDKNFSTLPNKCMASLINQQYKKQNIKFLSKEWFEDCYKSRPKDMCIFMYALLVGTLYYHFVLQTGVYYHKTTNHYYFCNVIHGLTVFLMTYIFIFVLKSECPSISLKLGLHGGAKNINFKKYDISKVNFKYLDRLFGYNQKSADNQQSDEIEVGGQSKKKTQNFASKRPRMNLLDYIVILVENEKFSELKKLNDRNVCYECLDIKEERAHHCDKFDFCVKNYSHFSYVFDQLIIKGQNFNKYYLIIALQWILLILFFVTNNIYCSTLYKFEGSSILTYAEIPFIYYFKSEWRFLGIYLLACVLFYLASVYFFIETCGILSNLTRYEIFYPNRCDYFYPNKNIQEFASFSGRRTGEQVSSFFKYYENPFSRYGNTQQRHQH